MVGQNAQLLLVLREERDGRHVRRPDPLKLIRRSVHGNSIITYWYAVCEDSLLDVYRKR